MKYTRDFIYMLFRNKDGSLIKIDKKDYINDKDYYKAICNSYGIHIVHKQNDTMNFILSLSKKGVNNCSNQNNNSYRENITKNHNISNSRF